MARRRSGRARRHPCCSDRAHDEQDAEGVRAGRAEGTGQLSPRLLRRERSRKSEAVPPVYDSAPGSEGRRRRADEAAERPLPRGFLERQRSGRAAVGVLPFQLHPFRGRISQNRADPLGTRRATGAGGPGFLFSQLSGDQPGSAKRGRTPLPDGIPAGRGERHRGPLHGGYSAGGRRAQGRPRHRQADHHQGGLT